MPRILSFLLWCFGGLGLAALTAILAYTNSNQSHHTGWEPYTAFFLFVPLVLSGLAAVLGRRALPTLYRPGLVAIAVGLLAIVTVIYLDQSNRLVQYERWIQRGMP
jgi:hypothetical protein